jgi:hypothetical protein
MLLVRSQEGSLLQHLAWRAPHAEAKAYGWIALVKLQIVAAEYARDALAALNDEVDICGGCEIVLKSDRAESLARYFDAPLPDERDGEWRPPGSPPPIELPGAPRIRRARVSSNAPPPESP